MGVTGNLIYNPPKFDYSKLKNYNKQIIYIKKKQKEGYIPCLFIVDRNFSPNFLIFFHGNSEDIFESELFGFHFSGEFHFNIIIVEYQGYSIYFGSPSSDSIYEDSLEVYDFIVKKKFKSINPLIFVCGRSLGTSPAIYLSSNRNVKALFLVSPFLSIKDVGKKFYLNSFIQEDIFNSKSFISNIKCPILFIHGKKDKLIPFSHSEELSKLCSNNKNISVNLRENMTHNKIDFKEDFIEPIKEFLQKYNIELSNSKNSFELKIDNLKEIFQNPYQLEQDIFKISDFVQINKINVFENKGIILSISDELFLYCLENIIQIYEFNKIIHKIKENDGKIIYIDKLIERKFAFLTNNSYFKIYYINNYNQLQLNNNINLNDNNCKKFIFSENKNVYVKGNYIYEIINPDEFLDNHKIVGEKINNILINNYLDIIEIKENIFCLTANNQIVIININDINNNIKTINDIFPIRNDNIHKLNEKVFIVITTTEFLLIDTITYDIKYKYNYDDEVLFFENEFYIGKKDNLLFQYKIQNQKIDASLDINCGDIVSLSFTHNKKYLLVLTKEKGIFFKKSCFNILIFEKIKNTEKASTCYII